MLGIVFVLFNFGDFAHQHFVTRKIGPYIVGVESREAFLQRLFDMFNAYPSGTVTGFINEKLPTDARILIIDQSIGYYIRRPVIDSRMVDGDFHYDTAHDVDVLISQWRAAGVTHIFVNENYVGAFKEGDTSRGLAMFVLGAPEFRDRCLEEVFTDQGQNLYALTCQD